MTLASWITLLRCFGGPLVAFFVQFPDKRYLAAYLFVAFALTDWLDGFIARRTNTITNFGKYIDPFADKILVMSVFVAMTYFRLLPLWGVLIVLIREMAVMLIRIIGVERKKILAASWSAKFKTVVQMAAVFVNLMGWPYALPLFWFAVVVTVYSFLEYVWVNRKLFVQIG
ncbi:CDP-diacylglycerol--glycerol-3-phosphate 3-phosphatidyltransferase [Candidatus Margulisiibacteriota bacterium]